MAAEYDITARVAEQVEHFGGLNVTAHWRVGALSQDRAEIIKALLHLGCALEEKEPVMALSLSSFSPHKSRSIDIQLVRTEQQFADWDVPHSKSFEMQSDDRDFFLSSLRPNISNLSAPYKLFVGYVDSQPVCCESM